MSNSAKELRTAYLSRSCPCRQGPPWHMRVGVRAGPGSLAGLAAADLALYFVGALGAHLQVHDRHLGLWAMYFSLAIATLAVNLAYRGLW